MESLIYEGSCFVFNICYSYWFFEENEKLRFVTNLYPFNCNKYKLSETTQFSHFPCSSDNNEIQK